MFLGLFYAQQVRHVFTLYYHPKLVFLSEFHVEGATPSCGYIVLGYWSS